MTFPTRKGNILDLVLSWNSDSVVDIREGSDNIGSDHCAINFTIPFTYKPVKQPKRIIYNFKRADWEGLKNALISNTWALNDNNVDVLWDNWHTEFVEIVNKFVPKVHCKSHSSAPWIDSDVIHLVKKKERAWIKF